MAFKILGINHLGLAPKDPELTRTFLGTLLGLGHVGDELVTSQKTLTAMFNCDHSGAQKSRLELLIPSPADSGPIADFLAKRGGGIHHVALTVDNVAAAIADLSAKGVEMIDKTPRPGAHHTKIAFIHPRATGGLLIELVEEAL